MNAHAGHTSASRLTLAGVLVAVALALSYLERFIPIQVLVPIPGVRLGLANIVTVFALIYLSRRDALMILVTRCGLQSLLFGSLTSLLFSLSGGVFAFCVMALLRGAYPKQISMFGLCIAGAAAHNVGQILAACLLFSTFSMLYYLSFLLLISIISGVLTGYVCFRLFPLLGRHMITR